MSKQRSREICISYVIDSKRRIFGCLQRVRKPRKEEAAARLRRELGKLLLSKNGFTHNFGCVQRQGKKLEKEKRPKAAAH